MKKYFKGFIVFVLPLIIAIVSVSFSQNYFINNLLIFGSILLLLVYTLYIQLSKNKKFHNPITSSILLISVLFGIISGFLDWNPDYSLIKIIITILCLLFFEVSFNTRYLNNYRISRVLNLTVLVFFPSFIQGSYKYLTNLSTQLKNKFPNTNIQDLLKQGFFVILLIPFAFIIVSLLSSTNTQFSDNISYIFDLIFKLNIATFFTWCFGSFVLIGGFIKYFEDLMYHHEQQIIYENKYSLPRFIIQLIIYATVLLDIIYTFYTYAEISCNSKGIANCVVEIKNMTYSQGASNSLYALAIVLIINFFVLYFGSENLIENSKKFRPTHVAKCLLVAFSVVLTFSSFQRLGLYLNGYGFTYFRFYALEFYIYAFVSTLIAIVGVYYRYNIFYNYIFALLFMTINLMVSLPVDPILINLNFAMYKDGMLSKFDPLYPYNKKYSLSDKDKDELKGFCTKMEYNKYFGNGNIKYYLPKEDQKYLYPSLDEAIKYCGV